VLGDGDNVDLVVRVKIEAVEVDRGATSLRFGLQQV